MVESLYASSCSRIRSSAAALRICGGLYVLLDVTSTIAFLQLPNNLILFVSSTYSVSVACSVSVLLRFFFFVIFIAVSSPGEFKNGRHSFDSRFATGKHLLRLKVRFPELLNCGSCWDMLNNDLTCLIIVEILGCLRK